MAVKTTNSKMEVIKHLINLWLTDQTFYCNYCGQKWDAVKFATISCCDNPQIGRNMDHLRGIIKQNKELQEMQDNDYASTDAMNMRLGVSMPPKLLEFLEKHFKEFYQEKLFTNNKELHKFMKEFPQFKIPKKI